MSDAEVIQLSEHRPQPPEGEIVLTCDYCGGQHFYILSPEERECAGCGHVSCTLPEYP